MKETTYLDENARLLEFLQKIPAFESFGDDERKRLLQISKLKMYGPGECILEEGSGDNWLYFLVKGRVLVSKKGKRVTMLKRRGDIFGEMGVISAAPRSASAHADGDVICLSTDFSRIEDFSHKDKVMVGYILYRVFSEILVEKLAKTTDELIRVKGKAGMKFW